MTRRGYRKCPGCGKLMGDKSKLCVNCRADARRPDAPKSASGRLHYFPRDGSRYCLLAVSGYAIGDSTGRAGNDREGVTFAIVDQAMGLEMHTEGPFYKAVDVQRLRLVEKVKRMNRHDNEHDLEEARTNGH